MNDGPPYKHLISLSERDARRVEVGARAAIAATRRKPEEAEWPLPYPPWTMWCDEFGDRWLQHYTFTDADTIATYKEWPLPLGAIVGSATVEAVVPIVDDLRGRAWPGNPFLELFDKGAFLWMSTASGDCIDLSDQRAYDTGLTPGRWAVLLTDAAPVHDRCPRCWGSGGFECDHSIDPIPYTATGRVGRWQP